LETEPILEDYGSDDKVASSIPDLSNQIWILGLGATPDRKNSTRRRICRRVFASRLILRSSGLASRRLTVSLAIRKLPLVKISLRRDGDSGTYEDNEAACLAI